MFYREDAVRQGSPDAVGQGSPDSVGLFSAEMARQRLAD